MHLFYLVLVYCERRKAICDDYVIEQNTYYLYMFLPRAIILNKILYKIFIIDFSQNPPPPSIYYIMNSVLE